MAGLTFRAALVGDVHSAEMAPVNAAVSRTIPTWEFREFAGLAELREAGETGEFFPELILIGQHFRDEYSTEEVRQALATFPVARWICAYGAWCESEGRHGSRWPMAVRVPLRSLETRLIHEAQVIQGRKPALPLTAARDEVFEFDADRRFPSAGNAGVVVAIHSPDLEFRDWLKDLCLTTGYQVALGKESRNGQLAIVDLDPWTTPTQESLRTFKQRHPDAAIVGLMGLPYPEDRERLQGEGVAIVLSKLTPSAQILETLRDLT